MEEGTEVVLQSLSSGEVGEGLEVAYHHPFTAVLRKKGFLLRLLSQPENDPNDDDDYERNEK